MKNFWKGYRQARELREREERIKERRALSEELRELVRVGGHEAESKYVEIVKELYRKANGKEMSKEDLQEKIRRFHAAVSERQSLDRGSS